VSNPEKRNSTELTSGREVDDRTILDFNNVARGHLTSFPDLDLAVDADSPASNQRLRFTAALDTTCQFQQLRQVDRAIADFRGSMRTLVHHVQDLEEELLEQTN
jgi:hypothetical protein